MQLNRVVGWGVKHEGLMDGYSTLGWRMLISVAEGSMSVGRMLVARHPQARLGDSPLDPVSALFRCRLVHQASRF